MPSTLDLAYLAGIVDADGHISVNRSLHSGRWRYYAPVIGITGTRREPHDLAASIWGGNVNLYRYSGAKPHHRPCYIWARQGRSAVPVIEALLPYLRIKVDQAHLALALQEHVEYGRDEDPYPWMPPDYDPAAHLDAIATEVRDLNQWRRPA